MSDFVKCMFKTCNAQATEYIECDMYLHPVLCCHHRELLTELRTMYKVCPEPEAKALRQTVIYIFGFKDSGHEYAAGVEQCRYCCVKDYKCIGTYPAQTVCDKVCLSCTLKRRSAEEKYYDQLNGWESSGYLKYDKRIKDFVVEKF